MMTMTAGTPAYRMWYDDSGDYSVSPMMRLTATMTTTMTMEVWSVEGGASVGAGINYYLWDRSFVVVALSCSSPMLATRSPVWMKLYDWEMTEMCVTVRSADDMMYADVVVLLNDLSRCGCDQLVSAKHKAQSSFSCIEELTICVVTGL